MNILIELPNNRQTKEIKKLIGAFSNLDYAEDIKSKAVKRFLLLDTSDLSQFINLINFISYLYSMNSYVFTHVDPSTDIFGRHNRAFWYVNFCED